MHLYTMRGFVAQVSLLGRTSQCNVTSIALFCAPLCVTFLFFISCTMYIYISLINFLIDCLFVYLPPSSPLHQNSVLPLLANSNIQLRNKPAQSLRATLTFSRPLICLPLIPPPLLLNTFINFYIFTSPTPSLHLNLDPPLHLYPTPPPYNCNPDPSASTSKSADLANPASRSKWLVKLKKKTIHTPFHSSVWSPPPSLQTFLLFMIYFSQPLSPPPPHWKEERVEERG